MKIKHILLAFFTLFLLLPSQAWAQRMIRVSGTVYNIANKRKRVPMTDIAVQIYSCKTVAEGQDILRTLDNNNAENMLLIDPESVYETDHNAYYEVLVPDNGALVFKAGMNPCVLEKVEGRMQIDVGIDDGLKLDEVVVTGLRTEIKPEPKNSRLEGNRFYPYNTFLIPNHSGNTFSRLIIQPYVINCNTEDTIAFCKPVICDGEEYHLTQRRFKGNDLSRDPLHQWISPRVLTTDRFQIAWQDTVIVPDPNGTYSCYADFVIEDYRSIRFHKIYQINTCENKRPLRFLEYSLLYKDIDFNTYRERAQVEKRNTADKVSLSFEINSNRLTDDPQNQVSLNQIRSRLTEILHSPGATVREFHVLGTSSPEGSYERNLELARKRLKRIQDEVTSVLPPATLARVYQNPQASVAPWTDVVSLMRQGGHPDQATQLQTIIDAHPGDFFSQNRLIRRLPFYQEIVTPYLEQLRQVEYLCKYDIYREPTDEEVLQLYHTQGLKGDYTRYEYWKLFQLLHSDKEIELLARKAYDESLQANPKRPWIVAANLLATSYLRRDTVDTSILEPLIDKTVYMVNYRRRNIDTNRMETINPVEIVVNQLCMYIRTGNFSEASMMAKILPDDEEYQLLKSYAWALGGYYHGGTTPEEQARSRKTFETVRQSSPRNEVVMYLALENQLGNLMAEKALANLPSSDALTWYFKATIAARKGDAGFTDAMMALSQCFKLDKTYIPIAQSDGEFNKEILEAALEMMQF